MAVLIKKNNAKSTINMSSGLTANGLTLTVTDGSKFPSSGDFMLTIWDRMTYPDPGDDSNMEIVRATSRSGNDITITRAQESTTAVAHANGSEVQSLLTAGTLDELSPTETDPIVSAINGIVKSNGTTISAVVSGIDIKTINSTSLLGSGDIAITTTESDPLSLHLDQTTPQDISGGQPDFLAGLRAGASNQLVIDNAGNITSIGDLTGTDVDLSLGTGDITTTGTLGVGVTTFTGTSTTDLPTYSAEFLLDTGWTSTDWTGDFATGWTHTTGNTSVLSQSKAAVSSTKYQIAYTVTGRTAGTFDIGFGGQSASGIYKTGAWGPTTSSTASLTITPTSDFNGKIVISIKSITAISSPLVIFKDSGSTTRAEIRSSALLGNTFFGEDSGGYTTTGTWNIVFGRQCLIANTTGLYNTVVGGHSMHDNITGSYNTAIGINALYYSTTGSKNSALGMAALQANITGSYNTAIGDEALEHNTTGSNNVAIGVGGRHQSDGATALTTPENSIYIGYGACGYDNDDDNSIVIGYNAIGFGANTAVWGNTSILKNYFSGGSYFNTTDTDGTPAVGIITAKGSTNDGTTNIFVGRDSDGANVATLNTKGNLTLSGKIVPRVNTVASSATPAINVDTTDIFTITALAEPITSMTSGLSGTAVDGQKLIIRIYSAAAQAISWGVSFRSIAPLPTTTVLSKLTYVGLIYNSVSLLWDCVSVSQE